ncbi:MAG: SEL1-like repeat protein [Elusimicrobiaceae bacterium]|nr:SEL1-like repeat protein [Elusimicrobiaceae bacterium]
MYANFFLWCVIVPIGIALVRYLATSGILKKDHPRVCDFENAQSNNVAVGKTNFIFEGKKYCVPAKYREHVLQALRGNEGAKYEIIIQGFSIEGPYIPELYFKLLYELAEKDLGVLVQMADSYLDGIGTPKDEEKARETYERALELYDNTPEGMYVPERSKEYRDMLVKGAGWREIER